MCGAQYLDLGCLGLMWDDLEMWTALLMLGNECTLSEMLREVQAVVWMTAHARLCISGFASCKVNIACSSRLVVKYKLRRRGLRSVSATFRFQLGCKRCRWPPRDSTKVTFFVLPSLDTFLAPSCLGSGALGNALVCSGGCGTGLAVTGVKTDSGKMWRGDTMSGASGAGDRGVGERDVGGGRHKRVFRTIGNAQTIYGLC